MLRPPLLLCLRLLGLALALPACVRSLATTPGASIAPGAGICTLGRVDTADPAGLRMAWPGTGLRARFTGTRVEVKLRELEAATYRGKHVDNHYDVEIDGRPPAHLATTVDQTEYLITDDLLPGTHTLTLIKRTEANMGTAQFLGLGLAADGEQLPLDCAPADRRLELIGDSTTSGYGVEASAPDDPACAVLDAVSNVRRTAGILAAQALGAEAHVLAFSGRGVLRNGNPNDTRMLAAMLDRSLPNDANARWDAARWQPQAVVVNLGANDLKAEPPLADTAPFLAAYRAFVGQVRRMHPQAQLWLAISPTLHGPLREAMRAAVATATAAFPEAHVLDYAEDDGSHGLGCDKHPNAATQAVMADQLTSALRAQLRW